MSSEWYHRSDFKKQAITNNGVQLVREIKEGFALLQLCQFLKLRCPGYSVCCMLYLGTGQLQEATRECNCRPLSRSHFDLITSATKCVRMLFVPIFNFMSSILISLIFMHQQEIVAKVSNLKFFHWQIIFCTPGSRQGGLCWEKDRAELRADSRRRDQSVSFTASSWTTSPLTTFRGNTNGLLRSVHTLNSLKVSPDLTAGYLKTNLKI